VIYFCQLSFLAWKLHNIINSYQLVKKGEIDGKEK